jgi:hypothetical protein
MASPHLAQILQGVYPCRWATDSDNDFTLLALLSPRQFGVTCHRFPE